MKIVIVCFVIAVVVCMLIEFRHKLFGSPDRPDGSSSKAGCFLGVVVVVLVLFFVVPFVVNFFYSDEQANGVPQTPPSLESDRLSDSVSLPEKESMEPESFKINDEASVTVSDNNQPSALVDRVVEGEARDSMNDAEPSASTSSSVAMVDEPSEQVQDAPESRPDISAESSPEPARIDDEQQPETEAETGMETTDTKDVDKPLSNQVPEAAESPAVEPVKEAVDQVQDSAPATAQAESPTPSNAAESESVKQIPVLDTPGGEPYTILIGSYKKRATAFEVASHFSDKGDPAFTSYYTDPYEGTRYQVFMGNFESMDEAEIKARELRERKFRQVDITDRMFAVQVGECSSYPVSEEIKAELKRAGYIAYGIRCPDTTGHIKIFVGAYLNDKLAKDAALEISGKGVTHPLQVVLR